MKHVAAHTAGTGRGYPPFINFAYDQAKDEVRIRGREGPTPEGDEGKWFELRIERCSAETLFEEGATTLKRLSQSSAA